jgi:hypothetical protein
MAGAVSAVLERERDRSIDRITCSTRNWDAVAEDLDEVRKDAQGRAAAGLTAAVTDRCSAST